MQRKFFESSGYTGHILEEEVLGHCRVRWNGSYMKFQESMRLARANQPLTLCRIADKFRKTVVNELSIAHNSAVDDKSVAIFTAIGSPLDLFHSIDGWFEFNGLVVTFDVTMSTSKQNYKANVVVPLREADDDFTIPARDIVDAFKWAQRGR